MPPTCETCGDDVDTKNSAGHWRDKCWSCIEAVAAERDLTTNPYHGDESI